MHIRQTMLECVFSAICVLDIPTPPLRVSKKAPDLRTASAAMQSHCWYHTPTSISGVAQELLHPAFLVAAEPEAGDAPDSRLLLCRRQRPYVWHQWGSTPPVCISSWFTSPRLSRNRGSSCILLLMLPCSVAAPHSSHHLRSCF